MLTKYHGDGNPDSEWVTLQLNEYEELLEMDGADKRWWDYRALFKSRATCYRLFCNVTVVIFGQWAGNGRDNLTTHLMYILTFNSGVILLLRQSFGYHWRQGFNRTSKCYFDKQLPAVLLGPGRSQLGGSHRSSSSTSLLEHGLLFGLACDDNLGCYVPSLYPST